MWELARRSLCPVLSTNRPPLPCRTFTGIIRIMSWRGHQMETFSVLLALCAGNSPVPDKFPTHRPVTRSFDVFFEVCLNKRLSKQSRGWWFETLSRPLWRHCNVKNSTGVTRAHQHPSKYIIDDPSYLKDIMDNINYGWYFHIDIWHFGLCVVFPDSHKQATNCITTRNCNGKSQWLLEDIWKTIAPNLSTVYFIYTCSVINDEH